jgi:hypothetical protein
MNIDLYNGIVARLTAKVPELKTIKLFNNQFAHSNNDEPRDEQAFLYPCAFIEFAEVNYVDQKQRVQDYTATLRVHIGFESYKYEDVDVFTLKQKVVKYLHEYQVSSPQIFGKILRRLETTDTEHNNIYVYVVEFGISGRDCDLVIDEDFATVDPPIELELTTNLDIDNDVIRTGNGL